VGVAIGYTNKRLAERREGNNGIEKWKRMCEGTVLT
jgi:hypothetical protein